MRLALACALGLGLLHAEPAAAEIYKCVGPDGRTTFTSDPGGCPNAVLHEPRGSLQTVPAGSPASRPARPAPWSSHSASGSEAQDAAQAARWRAKRTEAEEEKAKLDVELESYRRIVTGCNRGRKWNVKEETGIKRDFDCDEARADLEKMQARHAELADYLAGGLAEECRRAGCLPGWIR